jgi:hypothetical protein
MTIPATSISLGFHSQIEPHRSALTNDMPGMFERFGITSSVYEGFIRDIKNSETIKRKLPTAEAMLAKGLEIQEASARSREESGANAEAPTALIAEFLRMSAAWMVAEVALGVTAPDQPIANEPGEFIRRLYLLVYSSEFRKNPDPGGFDRPSWGAILEALQRGSGSFDDLLPHCQVLCGQVADEFTANLWSFIW